MWIETSEQLPPENERVCTISRNGDEAWMTRKGSLWFLDDNMYVYYCPKMWFRPPGELEW